MVQSLELILKEALRRKSDVLVYENIDTPFSSDSKTISFQNSVQRLLNLATNFISTEQKDFILNCGKIRNQFIHYKVKYNSIDIKKKFCKLVELYSVIHKKTTKEKIRIWKENEYYYKYCPHCIAKLGEYHLEMCSHEICSRCGEQLMCCDCAEGMIHIDLQDSKIN